MKKNKVTGLLMLAGAGAYAIIAMELLFRIFAPVPIIPRYVTGTPFGIRGNMPDMNYWHKSADFKINIKTNSKGIRADEEIPYEKPRGTKRIVVLGDSFGMGYEVSLEDSFLFRMEEGLEKKGMDVQVVNLSVSGHGNAEELIMLENEGLKYQPDIVLLCWTATDFDDNTRSNLYILENNKLRRNAATYLPGVHISDMLYRIPLFIPMSENSHIYNRVRDEAGGRIKGLLSEIRGLQATLKGSPEQTRGETRESDYSEKLTIALLDKIREECDRAGAKFIILDIPNQKGRYEFYSVFPQNAGRHITRTVISPIEAFHSNAVEGELFVNERSHFHFTPKACRLIGEELSAFILDKKLL